MIPLLKMIATVACCMSNFGLGLMVVAWWFRAVEPERWRRIATRHAGNAALVAIGIGGTAALIACFPPHARSPMLGACVIPPLIGSLYMGVFFGRLNHPKGKPAPDSDFR